MCSALQAEVTHLRGLVLQCLDDQKKLQQETICLSAQLQQFCRGMEGMHQVRTHHLGAHPCPGLTTLVVAPVQIVEAAQKEAALNRCPS